jgi:hypothetical protein
MLKVALKSNKNIGISWCVLEAPPPLLPVNQTRACDRSLWFPPLPSFHLTPGWIDPSPPLQVS